MISASSDGVTIGFIFFCFFFFALIQLRVQCTSALHELVYMRTKRFSHHCSSNTHAFTVQHLVMFDRGRRHCAGFFIFIAQNTSFSAQAQVSCAHVKLYRDG
jgi:hypothetical protein